MADDTTVLDTPASQAKPDAPPAAPPPPPQSVSETSTADVPPSTDAAPTVPEWVEAASRGDAKRAERLQRFTDPGALFDSYTELERLQSDRRAVRIPDEKATDDDKAMFRKMVGVPETPEGYKLPKEITEKLDDEDNAVLGKVVGDLHKSGGIMAHPEVVKGVHEAYLAAREEAAAQMLANAQAKHEECQAQLKKEFGGEFERNVGFASGLLNRYGDEETRELMKLPMADGTRLGDYAPLVRMLSKIGREIGDDPYFAEMSRSSSNALESMEARKEAIMQLRVDGKFKEYDAAMPELEKINAALQRHKK